MPSVICDMHHDIVMLHTSSSSPRMRCCSISGSDDDDDCGDVDGVMIRAKLQQQIAVAEAIRRHCD